MRFTIRKTLFGNHRFHKRGRRQACLDDDIRNLVKYNFNQTCGPFLLERLPAYILFTINISSFVVKPLHSECVDIIYLALCFPIPPHVQIGPWSLKEKK